MRIPQWLQSFWDFLKRCLQIVWDFLDWLDNEANPEVHRRISDWLCEQVYNLSDFLKQHKTLCILILGVFAIIIIIKSIRSDMALTKKIKEQEKEWDKEENDEQK